MSAVSPTGPINPAPSAENNQISREDRHQQLPIDKIVKATVVEGGLDRVILELNQQRISAETNVPLKTGQIINLLVIRSSPKLELRLVEDTLQQRLVSFLHLLDHKFDLGIFLKNISSAHQSATTSLSETATEALNTWLILQKINPELLKGTELQQLIYKLGLDLEAVLARGEAINEMSIKSILFEIMQKLGPADSEIANKAGNFLQQMEFFQLCQIRLVQEDIFLFPLPLTFLSQGFLMVEQEKKQNKVHKPDCMKLSILLALDGLGNLEIYIDHDAYGLDVRINCESLEKMNYVSEYKEELSSAISNFPLKGISVGSAAERPGKSILMKLAPKGNSVLDTRV